MNSSDYWERNYQENFIKLPSNFSLFVVEKFNSTRRTIFEIGCGDGRDAEFFIERGFDYIGFDDSESAIISCMERTTKFRTDDRKFSFCKSNFLFDEWPDFHGLDLIIYSRFVIHALTNEQRRDLFKRISETDCNSVIFVFENRTIFDELYGIGKECGDHSYFSDHFRCFTDPDALNQEICDLGWGINYWELSKDFAPWGSASPIVLRAICNVPTRTL
jgi:SAM-dependent methyltransferase